MITIVNSRLQEPNDFTVASYGTYSLDATQFSYRYDDTSVFVQTASGITVSHKTTWEGRRTFSSTLEDGVVRLRSGNGQQEFLFSGDGLAYSESGKVVRVWSRVSEKQ